MAGVRSLFHGFFLLLLHLGCFFSSSNPNPNPNPNTDPTLDEHTPTPKRRKISPVPSSPSSSDTALNNTRKHSSLSLSLSIRFRSHVNRLFSFRNKTHKDPNSHPPAQPISPPSPLHPSLPLSPDNDAIGGSISSEPATKRGSFSARTEIFPCPACGEVLTKAHLLDLHQATKHALSDLRDGDSGRNIVGIIFHSGWIGGNPPVIHRILKIHHSPRTLARFEEYREDVRSRGEDERCIADGNERLRFYCSTVMCALGRGRDGPRPPGACGAQFCSTCAIVRHGFSGKQAEVGGIATYGTSWDAHVSLPEDLEREFAFLHVRRAMLVCRVIAGRVARCGAAEEKGAVWDSVVPLRRGGGPRSSWAEDEELLVFSPRAVLPCFIIVYNS